MPTPDEQPGHYASLVFNSPLSDTRADRLASMLADTQPSLVLDVGCGWAELLLRVVARCDATGVGVDHDERVRDRAQVNAAARGLADRVRLLEALDDTVGVPDVVICCGSSQVFGDSAAALLALHDLVRPGGRVLYADGFWDATAPQGDDSVPDDMRNLPDLAGLVDEAIVAGLRPLSIGSASPQEWEEFESGYLADWENWLLMNPGHADAESVRAKADHHRNRWLRGYRHALGFAYLVLGRPDSHDVR